MYIYLIYVDGCPEYRGILFLFLGAPIAECGKWEDISHDRGASQVFLMAWDGPRCRGRPGEGGSHDRYTWGGT